MLKYCVVKTALGLFLSLVLLTSPAFAQTEEAGETGPPKTLYVVPFLNVMVPDTVSSTLFEAFIDQIMAAGKQEGMAIRILKQDIDAVDKTWLADQYFVTGEIFGYIESSGCCSTEIKVKVRIFHFQPGSAAAVGEIVVPGEIFFDHDLSTLENERALLAERIARKLSDELLPALMPNR